MASSLVALTTQAVAAPGDHIRVGEDLTITPDLDVGLEYRSNAFRAASNPQGTGAMRLAPGLSMGASTPSLNFAFDGEYVFRKHISLANPEGIPSEQNRQRLNNLDRFNDFAFGGKLEALRDRVVGFNLEDRAVLRNNPNDTVIDSDDPYATQIRNVLKGGLDVRPGPALQIGLNGSWAHSLFFVPTNEIDRDPFNVRNSYGAATNLKWMFFPRTAFVFNASYNVNQWREEEPALGGGTIVVPNSQAVRIDTGVHGRLTERLRLLARIGYGAQVFEQGPNLTPGGALLATLQGDYDVAEAHTITAGYRKAFTDSFFTNSITMNALYARWKGRYADRVTSSLNVGARFEGYTGSVERQDVVTQVDLAAGVDVSPWANLNANAGLLRRNSTDDFVEYTDVRALVGATFVY